MSKIVEFNCSTGVETVRDMTDEELAQWELDRERWQEEDAANAAAEEALAANKASGEAKLAELGLSADEIAALVG